MGRLTARNEQGYAYFPQCLEDPCNGSGCQKEQCEYLNVICEKLAEYEDTELLPDQIREIDKLYYEKCRELEEERKKHEWIPCSERLPEDYDNRFYMCVVENYEEDPPMLCQYEEGYGFGFWYDNHDENTLGYLDSEFKTNEELGYEKVIAWMPLPEPYHPNKCHGCFGATNNDCERCAK